MGWKNVGSRLTLMGVEIRRPLSTEPVLLAAKKFCGVFATCEIWANPSGVEAVMGLTFRRVNLLR